MYKYHLIELSNIFDSSIELIEQSYSLWESAYSEILKSSGETLNPDAFWRSKILAVIEKDNQVVGMHLYNSFDLRIRSINKHSYFSHIHSEKVEEIKSSNINSLMSCEFLTVHPSHRGKKIDISMAEVIVGLCSKVLTHSPWDALIGISRVDFKVDKMSAKIGANSFGETKRHNIDCKLVLAKKDQIKKIEHKETLAFVERLWSHKNNLTTLILNELSIKKEAA